MNGHPAEDELLALAGHDSEHEPRAESREHVSACAACTAQVASLRATQAALVRFAPASRNLCPDRAQLVAFQEAALHGFAKQSLDEHLGACPFCRDDLADLRALSNEAPALLAVRWLRGAVALVENALGELLPAPTPALARGGPTEGNAIAVARPLPDGARLEVLVAPGRTGVAVVATLSDASGKPLRFRVELARAGVLVEGQEAQDGRVHLDELEPARYELIVYRPGSRAPAVELELACL